MAPMSKLLFAQVGRPHGSALVTSTSIWCKMTDFKLVARKILTYIFACLIVAPLYVIALWALRHFLNNWIDPSGIVTIVVMVFILPWIMMALRSPGYRSQQFCSKLIDTENISRPSRETQHGFSVR